MKPRAGKAAETSARLLRQAKAASAWFRRHPGARITVLAAHDLSEEQLIELMLEEPAKYFGVLKTLAQEVGRRKAPRDVVETVQAALRATQRGIKNLGRFGYARKVLRTLKGTTDPTALDAVLAGAIGKAPDAHNERVLRAMRQKIGPGGGVVIQPPGGYCHVCCIVGCALCGLDECAYCCFIGCLICNIVLPM